jgi:NAD(P)H-flavin reductase
MSVLTATYETTTLRDPMIPRPAVVGATKAEAYGITTYTLSFTDRPNDEFHFKPGQFNMVYLPSFGEVAISISSDPRQKHQLGHTIRFAGNVTRGIGRLKVGDMVGLRGPFGSSWPIDAARGQDLLVVAGGIGLAPLRPVILEAIARRRELRRVILLYGARTPADLLYTDELEFWRQEGIELHVTVDRADDKWKGQVGVVPLLFYRVRFDAKETVLFTCGPEIMMRFVIYEAIARRVPPEMIWVSMERNMKCAIGLCGHCQYGPTFICKDGPVLQFPKIEPFFNREDF